MVCDIPASLQTAPWWQWLVIAVLFYAVLWAPLLGFAKDLADINSKLNSLLNRPS